jgi:hypothetical protein
MPVRDSVAGTVVAATSVACTAAVWAGELCTAGIDGAASGARELKAGADGATDSMGSGGSASSGPTCPHIAITGRSSTLNNQSPPGLVRARSSR